MARRSNSTAKGINFSEIVTRRPDDDSRQWASMSLGGTSLYSRSETVLKSAIDLLQAAIEEVSHANLLLIRQLVLKMTRQQLAQSVSDRVFGAVLGRTLRLGRVIAVPCLTVNNRILRTHLNANNLLIFNEKLARLSAMLHARPAVTIVAARAECFPEQDWGTSFMAQQLLQHLAYRGQAVCVDKDLFVLPRTVEHAVVDSRH